MEQKLPFPRRLPAISGKLVIGVVIVALVAGGAFVYRDRTSGSGATLPYSTAPVQTGNVVNTVTSTGPISASSAVPLNFKSSGKVTAIDVKVGDAVKVGEVLAQMDTSDLTAQLNQAKAGVANAQAAYDKLAQGPLPTDIAVAQAGVTAADNALANAKKNLATAQAQIAASQASDQVAVQNAQQALADAQKTQAALPAVITQQIAQAKNSLYSAQLTRDATCGHGTGSACDAANATVNAQQSAVDQANASAQQQMAQQQASVDSAQSALNTANASLKNDQAKNQASLVTAQGSVSSAQDGVTTAQANLAKAEAPSTQADLDAAKAQIASQQAAVTLAQNNLNAATLTSPVDGTVTALNGAVGQWLSGGATSGSAVGAASGAGASSSSSSTSSDFIDITQLSGLQVTSQVNEADIATVKVGQPVTFTVDAYPGRTFTGKVAIIQPLGQNVQNVVSYTVTSSVNSTNASLLPGMTASVNIITAQAQNVLEVPVAALTYARTQLASQLAQRATSGGGAAAGQARASGSANASASAAPAAASAGAAPRAAGAAQAGARPGGAARFAAGAAGAGAVRFEQPGGPGVLYVLKNGQPSPARVQFGISDGRFVQVTSGLSQGEQIVTGGGPQASAVPAAQGAGRGGPPRGGGPVFIGGRG